MKAANKPFPVPLSPSIRIGTPESATLSIFCFAVCMEAERPKMRWDGGRLPTRSVTPALEIAVVAIMVLKPVLNLEHYPR